MKNYKDYVGATEAAKILGLCPKTIRNYGKSGKLKTVKCPFSGNTYFEKKHLEEMLIKLNGSSN